ncbi:MAG: hypothetical protein NVS3B20_14710 [Polyangiales bacterium]
MHLDAKDDARVDESPSLSSLVVLTRHGGYVKRSLRMIEGACAALAHGPGRATCTIYDVRPAVCRELERGSPGCREARRARGLE